MTVVFNSSNVGSCGLSDCLVELYCIVLCCINTDVNECLESRAASCTGNAQCINVLGSFECSCPPGYKLTTSQRSCQGSVSVCLSVCLSTLQPSNCSGNVLRPLRCQFLLGNRGQGIEYNHCHSPQVLKSPFLCMCCKIRLNFIRNIVKLPKFQLFCVNLIVMNKIVVLNLSTK